MARLVPLWGFGSGFVNPDDEQFNDEIEPFVKKCAASGVTRLIPRFRLQEIVDMASKEGLEVHPQSTFNKHGGRPVYEWNLSFGGTYTDREVLDRGRPVWARPVPRSLSEFADSHRDWWLKTRDGSNGLQPGRFIEMSLGFPEVIEYEQEKFTSLIANPSFTGLEVEFAGTTVDESGTAAYGYEKPIVEAFQEEFGVSPYDIPNSDQNWVEFRGNLVTDFVRGLRGQVKKSNPSAAMTVAVPARDVNHYFNRLEQWPKWIDEQLIDELHLWFRAVSDPSEVGRLTEDCVRKVDGRCSVVVELSCFHPGSLQTGTELIKAARDANEAGANAVGLYRTESVEQLDLWSVVTEIAAM